MFYKSAQEMQNWKAEMHSYEKNKRTKKPFGTSVPKIQHVTYQTVKQKQTRFNPILQNFRKQEDQLAKTNKDQMYRARSLINHIKQHQKYERSYDIVNLHGGQEVSKQPAGGSPKKLGPLRNAYNVINNQKLPDFHFKNREMRLPVERQKKLIENYSKEYNIVTNIYNDDHELRSKIEQENQKNYIRDKYQKTHDYDPVFSKFYDQEKEEKYQEQRKAKQQIHGKDYDKRFPPSYVYREAYIPDPTKPLPESLQTLDEHRMNAKKRYRLKYIIEDEYGRRNIEDQQKKQKTITNHVHVGRVEEQKSKDFNIISMKNYPITRAQQLYRKPITKSTWQQLSKETSLSNQSKIPTIKTGGFN